MDGGVTRAAVGVGLIAVTLIAISPASASARPGDLDPSFSGDGQVVLPVATPFTPDTTPDVLVLGNGDILLAATAGAARTGTDAMLARFLPDGSLDPSFGTNGISSPLQPGKFIESRAAALTSGGGIVTAGSFTPQFLDFSSTVPALRRFNSDGSLDTNFGTNGLATLSVDGFRGQLVDVAVQVDGAIVAVGTTTYGSERLFVTRFLPDGELDQSFADHGLLVEPPEASSRGGAVLVQPDGRILVGGYAAPSHAAQSDALLMRLMPDGSPDPSFATGGMTTTDLGGGDQVAGLAIDSAGRIVSTILYSRGDFALTRHLPDGTLDSSFGDGGRVVTHVGRLSSYGSADIAIDSGDRVILAGSADDSRVVLRYATDGRLDDTFHGDGIVKVNVGVPDGFYTPFSELPALALQADGRIVTAGASTPAGGFPFVSSLTRHLVNDGPSDTDADGVLDPNDRCSEATVQSADGCMHFQRTIRARVEGPRTPGRLVVTMDTSKPECNSAVVPIYRQRHGRDIKKAEVLVSQGHLDQPLPDELGRGRYYLRVSKEPIPGGIAPTYGWCAPARSNTFVIDGSSI